MVFPSLSTPLLGVLVSVMVGSSFPVCSFGGFSGMESFFARSSHSCLFFFVWHFVFGVCFCFDLYFLFASLQFWFYFRFRISLCILVTAFTQVSEIQALSIRSMFSSDSGIFQPLPLVQVFVQYLGIVSVLILY